MMSYISNTLAQLIIMAASLHQESYDAISADIAAVKRLEFVRINPAKTHHNYVNYAFYFKVTLLEACEKACAHYNEPDMVMTVLMLLDNKRTNSLEWAHHILSIKPNQGEPDDSTY
jgi:hypothetical protein